MKKITCPYLGMSDDPTTALNFPSEGNFCHHAQPVAPVDRKYQRQFCLTTEHSACPIYLAAHPQPLPAEMTGTTSPAPTRRLPAFLSIPVLIVGTAALALVWNNVESQAWGVNSIPVTSGDQRASWSLIETDAKAAAFVTPNPLSSNEPTVARCPMPIGWEPYRVNPTDSLYRLSVIYGVSVMQLQQVNCMNDKTVIFPGQLIYVPLIRTETPTPTSVPAKIHPTNPPQPDDEDTPAVIPPTPEKPTNEIKDKGKGNNNDKGKGNGNGKGHGKGKGDGKGKGK